MIVSQRILTLELSVSPHTLVTSGANCCILSIRIALGLDFCSDFLAI
jgi:hypothetical protein